PRQPKYDIIRHMKRTTLFLDEQLEHDLRILSKRKGRPLASVVREAMAQYVARQLEQDSDRSVRFVASGRSGHTDTAERHEELLWGDLEPHGHAAPRSGARARPARRVPSRPTRSRAR
ncbi:MAG: hypothetical protein ACRD2A_17135, partial [Vicinamibacterales bacterium]